MYECIVVPVCYQPFCSACVVPLKIGVALWVIQLQPYSSNLCTEKSFKGCFSACSYPCTFLLFSCPSLALTIYHVRPSHVDPIYACDACDACRHPRSTGRHGTSVASCLATTSAALRYSKHSPGMKQCCCPTLYPVLYYCPAKPM